jgi:leucyl aminopeptidase
MPGPSLRTMPIAIELTTAPPDDVQATGLGVTTDQVEAGELPPGLDAAFLAARGFKGKPGETCVVAHPVTADAGTADVLVAVGLGARDEASSSTFRKAAAAFTRAAERHERAATTLLVDPPEGLERVELAQAVAEGIVLGSYRYTALKSDPEPRALRSVALVGDGVEDDGDRVAAALEHGTAVARAACLARDLVNTPGGTLTPTLFAEKAAELGAVGGFRVGVLDGDAIEAEKLGGLLGVNRGSAEEPRFLELSWEPDQPRATVALVGKGITFDSGGLSLKPSDSMIGMKGDMAGAAAVLGAFSALDTVRPPVRVLGFLPLTDNMPGGDATRVGDVLRIRNGATVEVLNTDAEGRLVLADALSMASEAEPDAIVDLATLTGACMVALGRNVAGLMGNDDDLVARVRSAADAVGEPVWPLPLPEDLRSQLDSEVADMKNIGAGRFGGALIAGLFLERFVADGIPWAHLDIAGPADAADEDAETRKGGTGFGVRTLLRLLTDFPAARSGG